MTNLNKHRTQLQTIFHFLRNEVATASQVAAATGVPHKNICRYKRDLEKAGRLAEVKKGVCPVTKFRAWFITCDESLFPSRNQLTIF